MNCTVLILLLAIASLQSVGQETLSGIVFDAKTHAPVSQANVSLVGGQATHDDTTDASGKFVLHLISTVRRGDIVALRVQKAGYEVCSEKVAVAPELPMPIQLVPSETRRSKSKAGKLQKTPTGKSASTGITDSVAVEVTRKIPPIEFSFTTSGDKKQRVPFSVRPQEVQIEPKPTLVKDEDLPADVPVTGGTITVLRFGDGYILLDTHDVPKGTTVKGQALTYVSPQMAGKGEGSGASVTAQASGASVSVGGGANVSAPFGIAIAPGATVVQPTVINNGSPPLPTPTVKMCVSYPPVQTGKDHLTTVTFTTNVQIVRPWFALFFDGPVLDGSAEMQNAGFFGYLHTRADRMPNAERSFVFRLSLATSQCIGALHRERSPFLRPSHTLCRRYTSPA